MVDPQGLCFPAATSSLLTPPLSVHGYIPTARSLPDTVFTVLQDLRASSPSSPRKTFLTGSSMGGLTVLYALTLYDGFDEETRARMPPIHGAFAMCPLLDVPDRPNAVVTAIGKLLSRVAGKVPLLDSGPLGKCRRTSFVSVR
jgi:alpha-beta hydrolase superfamily lysophospholipase